MNGRESLAQTFTLLSFGSAGLIGLVHMFDGVSLIGTGDSVQRLMSVQDTLLASNAEHVVSVDNQSTAIPTKDSTEHSEHHTGSNRPSAYSNIGHNQSQPGMATELIGLFPRAATNSDTALPQATENRSLNLRENSIPPLFVSSVAHQSSSDQASAPFLVAESSSLHKNRKSPDSDSGEQLFLTRESPTLNVGFSIVQPLLLQLSTQAIASQPSSRLVVDLSDRQVRVFRDGSLDAVFPIAVGRAGWETPAGEFEVISKQEDPVWQNPMTNQIIQPGADNPLGTHWIGFWSDGLNQIGFHGTNQNDLIGQAVSHGCIRMENEHIEQLYAHVSIGTPVSIQL